LIIYGENSIPASKRFKIIMHVLADGTPPQTMILKYWKLILIMEWYAEISQLHGNVLDYDGCLSVQSLIEK
jgi:hypothetical protein